MRSSLRRPVSIREKVREMSQAGQDPLRLYMLRRRAMTNRRLGRLGVFADRLGLDESFQDPAISSGARSTGWRDPASSLSRWEMQFYMGNMLLRDSDTNGMAHSLELRVPMLDTRIVNLACQIPNSVRLPGGAPPKHLLRTVFGHYLRPELTSMGKKGFTLPIRRWMMGPLRPMCEGALERVRGSGLLDRREVDHIWGQFVAQPETPVWSSAFVLAVLGTYLEHAQEFLQQSGRSERLIPENAGMRAAVTTTR